jgi:hypothetical protein
MYHFCTLFDKNYLLRGLTLYRSLAQHTPSFMFYVLCLDEKTYTTISKINQNNIQAIKLEEIETWDKRLKQAKSNRSTVEYYFTLSPALPLFLLETCKEIEVITYLDADLYFYQSPEPIYAELGNKSILIVEHRFPTELKHLAIHGRFNVEYQSFRKDEEGISCLTKWHNQCLNWCYDRLEGGKFADQKYLDEWPNLYKNLVILQHKGAGLAPWNWSQYQFEINKDDKLKVDNDPLVFYHFHGIKILTPCIIYHGLDNYKVMPKKYLNWFYINYINQMKETINWLEQQNLGQFKIDNGKQIRAISKFKLKRFYNSIKMRLKGMRVCK